MTTYTAPPTQTHLVLNGGDTLNVEVDGLAYGTLINQGAVLNVASSGTANNTIIQDVVSDTAGHFNIFEATPGSYDMNIYTPANYRLAAGQPGTVPISIIEGQTFRPEVILVSSPGTPAAPGVAYVDVYDFNYAPSTLRIKAGTTVTWQNVAPAQHTVASELNNDFRSGPMSRNHRFLHTFNTPGSYPYHCLFHEQMFGLVIVE